MYELTNEIEPGWMGWRRVKDDANIIGYKASSTPGTVAGLTEALEIYGTMKLSEVIAPAIEVAEQGFTVGWWNASPIFQRIKAFQHFDEWRRIFLNDGQFPYQPYNYNLPKPEVLVQKDLAKSLRSIAEKGRDAFYHGWIADAIVNEMAQKMAD